MVFEVCADGSSKKRKLKVEERRFRKKMVCAQE
jgi:hypothetical protein